MRRTSRARRCDKPSSFAASRKTLLEVLEERRMLTLSTPTLLGVPDWIEQGPAPINKGLAEATLTTQATVSGAVTGIAVDPNTANTVYVSTVGGGVWKSTNAGNNSPSPINWTPLTDSMPSLATTCITFGAPTNNQYTTLYVGTGNVSSNPSISGPGVGVYKSIDSGNTWQLVGSSYFNGLTITSIVTLPSANAGAGNDILLVGVHTGGNSSSFGSQRDGLYRSPDGGATWTKISLQSGEGDGIDNDGDGQVDQAGEKAIPSGAITSLTRDPSNVHNVFAAIAGNFDQNGNGKDDDTANGFPWNHKGVYESKNDGMTWQHISGGMMGITLPEDSDMIDNDQDGQTDAADPQEGLQLTTRILLSASATAPFPLYAATIRNDIVTGLFQGVVAADGVTWNWKSITGIPTAGNPTQADTHLSLLADNSSNNSVYIGFSTPQMQIDNIWAGDLYQVTPSTNTWTSIVGPGAKNSAPHADSRALVFATYGFSSDILEADDGGISRLHTYNTPASRQWTSDVGDLGVTQIVSLAYDPNSQKILAGNQDTGIVLKDTAIQNGPGANKSFTSPPDYNNSTQYGDGNTQAIAVDGTRYMMGNNFQYFSRLDSGSANAVRVNLASGAAAAPLTGLSAADQALFGNFMGPNQFNYFVIPMATNAAAQNAADPASKDLMLGLTDLYESFDNGKTISTIPTVGATGMLSALAYGGFDGATPHPEIFYAAMGSTIFVRTTRAAGTPLVQKTPPGAGAILSIALDPKNWKTAFATDGVHLYKTTDNGQNWASVGAARNCHNAEHSRASSCPFWQ